MKLNFKEDEKYLFERYLEHQEAMTQAGTDKQSMLEYEECRSYASQIVHAILRENPHIANPD